MKLSEYFELVAVLTVNEKERNPKIDIDCLDDMEYRYWAEHMREINSFIKDNFGDFHIPDFIPLSNHDPLMATMSGFLSAIAEEQGL